MRPIQFGPRLAAIALCSAAVVAGATHFALAQHVPFIRCQLGPAVHQTSDHPAFDAAPTLNAARQMESIYLTLCPPPQGCGRVTLFSNPTTPNASAQAARGESVIRYNADFMNQVVQQFGLPAAVGILAHELGHHIDINLQAGWMSDSWGRELRADGWAGCFLGRAILPSSQMETALRAIAAYPSPSHPSWPYRVEALRAGYVACGGVQPQFFF